MARVVNELREARELAESLAEALERERADRANETKAKEEERARSEEVLRRKAGQMSERAAALDRELAATRSELDDVRASLTTHLLSEERRVGADALRSRYAAKRSLRRWLSHAVVAKHGRVLRLACFRRAGAFALLTWSLRVRTQRRARAMLARWYKKGAVAAIRAWRLAALVAPACAFSASRCVGGSRTRGAQGDAAAEEEGRRAPSWSDWRRRRGSKPSDWRRRRGSKPSERGTRKRTWRLRRRGARGVVCPSQRAAATLHKSLSTWRIMLIRSRAPARGPAGTCDNPARAAENAAPAAAGVEYRNAELGDAAEALRERIIVAEQRAEEFERAASVESAERKAMEEELERTRDRASRAEGRRCGVETRARRPPRRRRRGGGVVARGGGGERAIVAAAEALQEWPGIEPGGGSASRSPRKGGSSIGTPGPGSGTPPRMSRRSSRSSRRRSAPR